MSDPVESANANQEKDRAPVRVSFVCLGNICRSPTAEAVMRKLVGDAGLAAKISIDSAGTGDWHVGEPRDRRSSEVGRRRGIPLSGRARHFVAGDFDRFDYVLAMDRQNHANLLKLAPDPAARSKVFLLRSFEANVVEGDDEVPDPYYGGAEGFDRVFDICLAACEGLLQHLRRTHGF
ncbi:MAG TPA: low molecular weight protein-tyrosine-phosphatase [Polyangia bacterium]